MTATSWIVIGACVVAIVVSSIIGRRLGFIKFTLFGNTGFSAGQERAEASANYCNAGRNLNVATRDSGVATADHSSAGKDNRRGQRGQMSTKCQDCSMLPQITRQPDATSMLRLGSTKRRPAI